MLKASWVPCSGRGRGKQWFVWAVPVASNEWIPGNSGSSGSIPSGCRAPSWREDKGGLSTVMSRAFAILSDEDAR